MFNQDVIHLAERTELGTAVVVRTYDESVEIEGMEMANRGFDIPPKIVDPEVIYAAVEGEKEAPGQPGRAAHQHDGHAGDGGPDDIARSQSQARKVPDRRRGQAQMRVIGQ